MEFPCSGDCGAPSRHSPPSESDALFCFDCYLMALQERSAPPLWKVALTQDLQWLIRSAVSAFDSCVDAGSCNEDKRCQGDGEVEHDEDTLNTCCWIRRGRNILYALEARGDVPRSVAECIAGLDEDATGLSGLQQALFDLTRTFVASRKSPDAAAYTLKQLASVACAFPDRDLPLALVGDALAAIHPTLCEEAEATLLYSPEGENLVHLAAARLALRPSDAHDRGQQLEQEPKGPWLRAQHAAVVVLTRCAEHRPEKASSLLSSVSNTAAEAFVQVRPGSMLAMGYLGLYNVCALRGDELLSAIMPRDADGMLHIGECLRAHMMLSDPTLQNSAMDLLAAIREHMAQSSRDLFERSRMAEWLLEMCRCATTTDVRGRAASMLLDFASNGILPSEQYSRLLAMLIDTVADMLSDEKVKYYYTMAQNREERFEMTDQVHADVSYAPGILLEASLALETPAHLTAPSLLGTKHDNCEVLEACHIAKLLRSFAALGNGCFGLHSVNVGLRLASRLQENGRVGSWRLVDLTMAASSLRAVLSQNKTSAGMQQSTNLFDWETLSAAAKISRGLFHELSRGFVECSVGSTYTADEVLDWWTAVTDLLDCVGSLLEGYIAATTSDTIACDSGSDCCDALEDSAVAAGEEIFLAASDLLWVTLGSSREVVTNGSEAELDTSKVVDAWLRLASVAWRPPFLAWTASFLSAATDGGTTSTAESEYFAASVLPLLFQFSTTPHSKKTLLRPLTIQAMRRELLLPAPCLKEAARLLLQADALASSLRLEPSVGQAAPVLAAALVASAVRAGGEAERWSQGTLLACWKELGSFASPRAKIATSLPPRAALFVAGGLAKLEASTWTCSRARSSSRDRLASTFCGGVSRGVSAAEWASWNAFPSSVRQIIQVGLRSLLEDEDLAAPFVGALAPIPTAAISQDLRGVKVLLACVSLGHRHWTSSKLASPTENACASAFLSNGFFSGSSPAAVSAHALLISSSPPPARIVELTIRAISEASGEELESLFSFLWAMHLQDDGDAGVFALLAYRRVISVILQRARQADDLGDQDSLSSVCIGFVAALVALWDGTSMRDTVGLIGMAIPSKPGDSATLLQTLTLLALRGEAPSVDEALRASPGLRSVVLGGVRLSCGSIEGDDIELLEASFMCIAALLVSEAIDGSTSRHFADQSLCSARRRTELSSYLSEVDRRSWLEGLKCLDSGGGCRRRAATSLALAVWFHADPQAAVTCLPPFCLPDLLEAALGNLTTTRQSSSLALRDASFLLIVAALSAAPYPLRTRVYLLNTLVCQRMILNSTFAECVSKQFFTTGVMGPKPSPACLIYLLLVAKGMPVWFEVAPALELALVATSLVAKHTECSGNVWRLAALRSAEAVMAASRECENPCEIEEKSESNGIKSAMQKLAKLVGDQAQWRLAHLELSVTINNKASTKINSVVTPLGEREGVLENRRPWTRVVSPTILSSITNQLCVAFLAGPTVHSNAPVSRKRSADAIF